MMLSTIVEAEQSLEHCRTQGSFEQVDAIVQFCATHPDGLESCLKHMNTTRMELQELLWRHASQQIRIADNRLTKKTRSGSSFDAGSYNYGSFSTYS